MVFYETDDVIVKTLDVADETHDVIVISCDVADRTRVVIDKTTVLFYGTRDVIDRITDLFHETRDALEETPTRQMKGSSYQIKYCQPTITADWDKSTTSTPADKTQRLRFISPESAPTTSSTLAKGRTNLPATQSLCQECRPHAPQT